MRVCVLAKEADLVWSAHLRPERKPRYTVIVEKERVEECEMWIWFKMCWNVGFGLKDYKIQKVQSVTVNAKPRNKPRNKQDKPSGHLQDLQLVTVLSGC